MDAANLSRYRDPVLVHRLAEEIRRTASRNWTLMEVCGGQTHAILRHGLHELLAPRVDLVHGPGCPVCVTPVEMIDLAAELALRPECEVLSFGDMLRVPGSSKSLQQVRAAGGRVRIIYSPLDALKIAAELPHRQIVLFAVGFETTAPTFACVLDRAIQLGVENLSFLCALVRVPPAISALASDADCAVQGFLAPGHVCTVRGFDEYRLIAERHHVPVAITGFEPADILAGVLACVRQLERGEARVENVYTRVARARGNLRAQALVQRLFVLSDRPWRGFGAIPGASLAIHPDFRFWDAEARFATDQRPTSEAEACRSAAIMAGKIKPPECPAFGDRCRPETPLGAPMVSSEGACAAYFHYRSRT